MNLINNKCIQNNKNVSLIFVKAQPWPLAVTVFIALPLIKYELIAFSKFYEEENKSMI